MDQKQDISLARAVFVSALIRSESGAPEVSREDATIFAKTILKTCNICTTSNVKLCKSFIITYILASRARIAALAKYLVTLSKGFCPRDLEKRIDTTKPGDDNEGLGKIMNGKVQQPPEPAFKRLHILYIVHDVLNHVQRHVDGGQHLLASNIIEQLRPTVCLLAELAACGGDGKVAKTLPILTDLFASWKTQGLLSAEQLEHIRERTSSSDALEWDALLSKLVADEDGRSAEQKRLQNDQTRWILPDRHGVIDDPTAPWHELPAANGLYMMRTRGYPLRANAFPRGGFQLQHGGEEADAKLKNDVTNIYNEVLRCYDKYTKPDEVQDVDALGNIVWKDPDRPTRNYWGFTLDGVDKRKQLARDFADSANGYDGLGSSYSSGERVNDAVERARMLATERGRGMGRGRGMARGGWRDGRGRAW